MYRNHTVGVVVPAYNEEGFVGDVVRDMPDFVDVVVLVDDASLDGTWREMGDAMNDRRRDGTTLSTASSVVERAGNSVTDRIATAETVGGITRVRHRENRGAGGAVKTGYFVALETGVDVIATIDGDGQMDSSRLPDVLDPIVTGQAGYAKGNRFSDRDVVREMPAFRLVGNVLLTGLTRIASGYWRLSDPQNGYTAISREALCAVDVDSLWEYYGYMNQLVARLNARGVRIADVPMPTTYGAEESHIDYYEYIRRVSGLLLVSFLQRLWAKYAEPSPHPVLLGYAGGVIAAVSGAVEGILAAATDGDATWGTAIRRLLAGTLAAVAAAVIDGRTGPRVEKAGVTTDREERREESQRTPTASEGRAN